MAMSDTTESTKSKDLPAPPTRLLAGLGIATAAGALIASSCCVVPLALAGLGASSAVFSGFNVLAGLQPLLLGGAALALAVAWMMVLRQPAAGCNTDVSCGAPDTKQRTVALLSAGTVIVGLALVWTPFVEPALLKFVR